MVIEAGRARPHRPGVAIVATLLALVSAMLLVLLSPTVAAADSWDSSTVVPESLDVAPLGFGNATRTVVDRDGTSIAAWEVGFFANAKVYIATRPSGGDWSEPESLDAAVGSTPVPGTLPSLATAANGTTTAVWADPTFGGTGVWSSTRAVDGGWSTPVNVSAGAAVAGSGGAGPRVVIDQLGNTTVAWQTGLSLYSVTRPAGGPWGTPVEVFAGVEGQDNGLSGLALAVDAFGGVTVVWRAGLNNANVVYAKRRPAPDTAWGALEQIAVPPDYYYYFEAAASSGGNSGGRYVGEVTVAFTNGESGAAGRVFVATREGDGPGSGTTGSWSTKEFTGAAWLSPPDVAYDPNGKALVAFTDQSSSPQRVALVTRQGGEWSASPATVAVADPSLETIADTDIAVDGEGNATALWIREGPAGKLAQAANRPAGGAWGAVQTLSSNPEVASRTSLAVDALGNATAVWVGETTGVTSATFGHTPAVRTDWTGNGLAGTFNLRTWINYLSGNKGVELSSGASRVDDVDPYSFRFTVADAWTQAETGETVIANQGTVRYTYPGHYIDTRIVNPEIHIAAGGSSGVVVADGQGSGSMAEALETGQAVAIPFSKRKLLNLDLSGIAPVLSADGSTRTWSRVPATIHPDGVEILSYDAGSAYGFITITVPATLPVRSLPAPPGPGPGNGGPGTTTEPSPAPQPPPKPAPVAKALLKPAAKQAKVAGDGTAKVAQVACSADGGTCSVKAPKTVKVKIDGKEFSASVLAPKKLGAGKSAAVKVKLGKGALDRLTGKKATVKVKIEVSNSGGTASTTASCQLSHPSGAGS